MNLTEATILALQNAKKVTESEKIVNQGYCPKCNAPLTGYYDEAQWYSGYIGYPFQCPKCGTKGEERCDIVYKETVITEEPINVDDKSFAEIWMSESYDGMKFEEQDITQYFSQRGERMRSKSEVLIANSLLNNGIPYKYEYPLQLSNGKIRYPDFTVLNLKARKITYWEHLGKMGDIDYISYTLKKLEEYRKDGIVLGDNLVITMESGSVPLSTKDIDKIIECVFLKCI